MATNFITPKFKLDPNADKYFIKKPSYTPPEPPKPENTYLSYFRVDPDAETFVIIKEGG